MKRFIAVTLALFLLSAAFAAAGSDRQRDKKSCLDLGYQSRQEGCVGSPDKECTDAGYDFAIAKWEWEGGSYRMEYEKEGYATTVSGSDGHAAWTSVPAAAGILSKEGLCYQELEDGLNGEIENIRYGISHVTICGNNPDVPGEDPENPDDEVPEFTAIGAGIALVGTGIIVARRRKE